MGYRMMAAALAVVCATGSLAACGGDEGNVFFLEVGQCFADAVGTGEVAEVDIVDCAEPHLNEIYAVESLPDGDFPLLTIDEDAAMLCLEAFESYVGIEYAYSIYDVNLLQPTMRTWNELDDREVVCFLFDINGKTKTGTARASGR